MEDAINFNVQVEKVIVQKYGKNVFTFFYYYIIVRL